MRLHDPSGNAGALPECDDQIDYNLPNQDVKALPDNPTLGGMRGNASGSFETSDSVDSLGGQNGNTSGFWNAENTNSNQYYDLIVITDVKKYTKLAEKIASGKELTNSEKRIEEKSGMNDFLSLAGGAIIEGRKLLKAKENSRLLQQFAGLKDKTKNTQGKPEFGFSAYSGKRKIEIIQGTTKNGQKISPIKI